MNRQDFINLYEELNQLNESKQDTLNFKHWLLKKGTADSAADEWVKRFDGIKKYLKAPENDYYFWIKKADIKDFYEVVTDTERYLEVKRNRKAEVEDGAELVCESEHWKVYHITNFEASQVYGRDSKWCITGIGSYGDRYWNDYTRRGYSFYFAITKDEYNPRGEDSKFAFAIHAAAEYYQIFNQQDSEVYLEDIPFFDEIKIPGINFQSYTNGEPYFCDECSELVPNGEFFWGPDGECYCEDCWNELYFECYSCGAVYRKADQCYEGADGYDYCFSCWNDTFFECSDCYSTCWLEDAYNNDNGEMYCQDCWEQRQEDDEE